MGERATLTCSTDFSKYMVTTIEWLDPVGDVVDSMAMAASLGLVIDPVSDGLGNATYTCIVTHSNGTKYTGSIVLSVKGQLEPTKG